VRPRLFANFHFARRDIERKTRDVGMRDDGRVFCCKFRFCLRKDSTGTGDVSSSRERELEVGRSRAVTLAFRSEVR